MRQILFFIILFWGVTISIDTKAQHYNFTNYSLEQGLPQSSIYSIFQDSRGYLWVGTESGVARFNGSTFTVFDKEAGLPDNIARSITEGADGNIWVGTDKGIGIYNGSKWKQITVRDGLEGPAVTKLAPDNQGRMWVGTNDAGVSILSFHNDSILIKKIDNSSGLSSNFVFDILHDKNGKTWLALYGGGINMLTYKNDNPAIFSLSDSVSIPSNSISCIDQDSSGNLWFGTLDAGAFEIEKSNGSYKVTPFNQTNGLTDSRIWDIFCDGEDQIWFGSQENGLYRLYKGVMQNISAKNGLPGSLILKIFRDKNRNLWLGSMNNGLSLFQGFHLVHYSSLDGLPGEQVFAIKPGSDNSIWVGGNGKGLAKLSFTNDKMFSQLFDSRNNFHSKQVNSIDFDGNGNLLAGTYDQGLLFMKNKSFSSLTTRDGLADNSINCVYWNKNNSLYVGTNLGFNEIKGNKIYTINEDDQLINSEVQTVISDLNGDIWMGTMGGLVKFQKATGSYRDFDEVEGLFDLRIHALVIDKLNQLYIGTSNGIYRYDAEKDTITPFLSNSLNGKTINSLLFYNDSVLIAGTNLGFNKIYFNNSLNKVWKIIQYDKMNGFKFSETNLNAICKDASNHVWFGTVNGLTSYRPDLEDTLSEIPLVHITGIRLSFETVDWKAKEKKTLKWFSVPEDLTLNYNQNHITFDFDGLYFKNPEKVRFRYKLEPYEMNWAPSINGKSVTYPGLNNGEYRFWVSASADAVHWSEPAIYRIIISPPFWKTFWFYILCAGSGFALLVLYIQYRERKLTKEKEHLEKVVTERTSEIVSQKEHIEIQHKILSVQKQEITSSITYARRIQQAVLPGLDILQENTKDSFVLYKPRDIVSGDFYWIGKSRNLLIVTAADCTGHGVPGAFMSMLGISFMNKIIKEQKIEMPEKVLSQLREDIIASLHQGNYEGTTKDGMDMALCVINLDTLIMSYAGAYNPAIVISDNQAIELKANRMPVGYFDSMGDFTPIMLQLKKGDCVYLFSDGYQDQMGGPTGRKFMRKKLRELLVEIHQKPFPEQKAILDFTIENWRKDPDLPGGEVDQTDDILILSFSV